MRRWYSATDLAGLPGMPNTAEGVRQKAELEGWPFRTALDSSVFDRVRLVSTAVSLITQGVHSRKAEARAAEGTKYSARSVMRWRLMTQGRPESEWVALLSDRRKGKVAQ